jgi:hypothetical protein
MFLVMRITLFRALQGIKVSNDEAVAVVSSLEAHVESAVNHNIKAVEGKLERFPTKWGRVRRSESALNV